MVQNTNQNPDEETGGVNGSQPDDEFERIAAEEIGTETTLPEEERPISLLALWDALIDLQPHNIKKDEEEPVPAEDLLQMTLLLPQHKELANLLLLRHNLNQTRISNDPDRRGQVDHVLHRQLKSLQYSLLAPKLGARTGRQFKTDALIADLKYRTADDRLTLEKVMENPEALLKDLDDKNSFGFRTQPQNRLVYSYDDKIRTEYDGKTYRVHYKKDFWGDDKLDKKDGQWRRHNPLNEGLQDHSRMILMQLKANGHKTFSFDGKCSMRFVEAMLEARKRVPGIRLNVGSLTDLGFSEKQLKKLEKKYGLVIPRPAPEQDQGPIQLGRDSFFQRVRRRVQNFGSRTVDALRGTPRGIRTFFTTSPRQTLRNIGQSLKNTGQRLTSKARSIRRKMGNAMGHVGDKIADGIIRGATAVERTYKSKTIGGKLLRGYTYASVHIVLGAGLGVLAPIVGLVNKKAGRKLRRIKVKAYLKMRQEKREYRQRWAQEKREAEARQRLGIDPPPVSAWQKTKNAGKKTWRGLVRAGKGIAAGTKIAFSRKYRGYTAIAGMMIGIGLLASKEPKPLPDSCGPYKDPLTKIIDGVKNTADGISNWWDHQTTRDTTLNVESYRLYREAKNAGKDPDDPSYIHENDAQNVPTIIKSIKTPTGNSPQADTSAYTAPQKSHRADFQVEARRYREAVASMTTPVAVKSPAKTIYHANKTDLAGLGLKPLSPRNEFKI